MLPRPRPGPAGHLGFLRGHLGFPRAHPGRPGLSPGWPARAAGQRRQHSQQWNQILADRIEALGAQIERMTAAREYLEHILLHHHAAPDGCPHYEALIWLPPAAGAPRPHLDGR